MFFEKYLEVTEEKKSFININLDPALPRQRKENVIPDRMISKEDCETLLDFSMEIIEQVGDYCCSVKPNTQYFLGNSNILKKLTKRIHEEGMLSILDHKLGDIESTNDSAMFWISDMGFDAFTFSPFAGNLENTVPSAHAKDLGVFVLTLMSNPEAENVMVKSIVEGLPYYLHIAETVKTSNADGCVVGLTGFVKSEYVESIQRIVGDQTVFLLQGIGPQGGKVSNIKYVTNPLISLGRSVIYSNNPKEAIKKYYNMFNPLKRIK